jgi:LppP/LprE lipoprotein
MPALPRSTIAIVCVAATAAVAAGCGSQTKTVSVGGGPPATQSATSASQTQTGTTTTAPSGQTTSTPAGGTPAPATTRTAPEPAFTESQPPSGGVRAAVAVLQARGYTPNDTAQYHGHQTLAVLVGRHSQSGDGYGQLAFFFVDGRYIGTDAKEPSATVRVVSQSDTEVTLAYPLYRRSDPLCCPGGGQATVHFQLNNGHLMPLGTIPPVSRAAGLSRY